MTSAPEAEPMGIVGGYSEGSYALLIKSLSRCGWGRAARVRRLVAQASGFSGQTSTMGRR